MVLVGFCEVFKTPSLQSDQSRLGCVVPWPILFGLTIGAALGGDGAATMVAKKKTSSVDNINARLSLVVKSGKISLGHRTTIKALRKSQGPPQHRAAGSGCALPRAAAPAAPLVVPCPRAGAPPPQFR